VRRDNRPASSQRRPVGSPRTRFLSQKPKMGITQIRHFSQSTAGWINNFFNINFQQDWSSTLPTWVWTGCSFQLLHHLHCLHVGYGGSHNPRPLLGDPKTPRMAPNTPSWRYVLIIHAIQDKGGATTVPTSHPDWKGQKRPWSGSIPIC